MAIRRLLCRVCREIPRLTSEDRERGYVSRSLFLSLRADARPIITVNGEEHTLEDFHCDSCNQIITGQIVQAVTIWDSTRHPEPPAWELSYGQVLPPEAVVVHDKLTQP